MQKRMWWTLLIAAILVTLGTIQSFTLTPTGMVVSSVDDAFTHLDDVKSQYNTNLDKVPNFVKTIIGSEKINATITRLDGSKVYLSVDAQSGVLRNLTTDTFDSYTMDLQANEATIQNILNASDQAAALKSALEKNEITYQPRRFTTSVKTGAADFFVWVWSFFK